MQSTLTWFFSFDITVFLLWLCCFFMGLKKVNPADKCDIVMVAVIVFFVISLLATGIMAVVGAGYLIHTYL